MSRSRRTHGAAAVEFALVAVIFFGLLIAAMEMGRLLWTWNAAVEATRKGARMAVVCDKNDPDIKTRMIQMLPLLTTSNITIDYFNPGAALNSCTPADCKYVQISLTGVSYTPIMPFYPMGALALPPFTTTQRKEFMESTNNTACS